MVRPDPELGRRISGAFLLFGQLMGVALIAAFVCVLGEMPAETLPQLVSGEDALSVAFGGAKEAISQAMVQKADSYFHGGIDMDCPDHPDHPGEPLAEHSNIRTSEHSFPDPWRWINDRICAPQVHRHLEGKEAVEMIPWLWASVKTNPHNIDSWTTAWYTANDMMKDRAFAAEILEEGLLRNPDSIELRFYLGRHLYDRGKGDPAAAERTFAAARDVGLRLCDGDLTRLSEKDRDTYSFIVDYLAAFAAKRGERTTLEGYLAEVEKTKSTTPVADAIRARIRRLAK